MQCQQLQTMYTPVSFEQPTHPKLIHPIDPHQREAADARFALVRAHQYSISLAATEKSWLAGHRLVLLGHIPSHHERRWAKPPHQSSEGRYMCSDAITSHGPACVGSAVVTRLPRTSVVSGSNPDAAKDMLY